MNADVSGAAASSLRSNKTTVASLPRQPEYFVVGKVLRPHGVRGEVRMRILTDYPDNLIPLKYVYLGDSPDDSRLDRRALESVRFNKEYALLMFAGFRSRTDAEQVRDKTVMIDFEQAAPLEDGQYFLYQVIGLKVVADEMEIGHVKEVLQTGANDVYVVDTSRYGEILIPAHAETIDDIDFSAGVVTMSLPEGLLPTK